MAQRGKRSVVKVTYLGKMKTFIQMISIAFLLMSVRIDTNIHEPMKKISIDFNMHDISSLMTCASMKSCLFAAGSVGFYLATILTVISAYEYMRAAWPIIKEQSR